MLLGTATSGTHTKGSLEGIVDPPLKTSQGTDHQDTSTQTSSAELLDANLGGDLAEGLTLVLGLTDLGDQAVSRVGYNGADYTSDVTRSEGNTKLGGLAVGFLGGGEDVIIEHFHGLLEEVELSHGVRNLSAPQRHDTSEGEPSLSSPGLHGSNSGAQLKRESTSRGSLNLDLYHLHGAKGNIGEELGGGRTGEVDKTSVFLSVLLASQVLVEILEDFIKTKLAESLHGITNSGGQPTLPDASGTFLSNQGLEARQQTLELGGVYLHVAFDDVQRTDQGVGETTAQYAGNHALEVVGVVVGNSGILEARIPFSRWLRGHL